MRKALNNAFLQSPLDLKGHELENIPAPLTNIFSEYTGMYLAACMIAGEYKLRIIGSADGLKWYPISAPVTFNTRTVTDGVTTNGSAVITSATAVFKAGDVTRVISGAGIPAGTTILTRDSATQVTVSANATASATGVSVTVEGPNVADPSIMYRDGRWWVAMTGGDDEDSYNRASIAYSDDLVNWTMLPRNQRPDTSAIAVIKGQAATWAGEWFIDDDGTVRLYLSISPDIGGGFGAVGGFGLYETHALNDSLTAWSAPVLVFQPVGESVIDAFVFKVGSTYNMLYANKTGASTYIEWATCATATGTFTRTRAGNWAGWGNELEAPSLVRITDTHWRMWFDQYTNRGIYYSDSFDAGATWSAKALVDGVAVTGSETLWFSHPTIIKIGDVTKQLQVMSSMLAWSRSPKLYAPPFRDVQTFDPHFPPAWMSPSRRVTIALNKWVFGQDLYSLGDTSVFVIHSIGKDAVVFDSDGNGSARLGPYASPGSGSTLPYNLSLNSSYSTERGKHAKIWLLRDPSHVDPSDDLINFGYGLGVSSPGGGATPQMDFLAGLSAGFAWYAAAVEMMSLRSGFLDVTNAIRSSGSTIASTGIGAEVLYVGGRAVFQGYNRTGAAYIPATLTGSDIKFDIGAVNYATIDSTNGFVTNGKMGAVGLPVYANNAAAVAGGLAVGRFYRTGGDPDPVCVVH